MIQNYYLMRIAIISICLTFSFVAASQNRNASFSLLLGPSVPIGEFGESDLTKEGSGTAKLGQSVAINFNTASRKGWSIIASLSAQRNPVNETVYEEQFSKPVSITIINPTTQSEESGTYSFTNWKFKNKPWLQVSLRTGVQKNVFETEKVDVFVGILGGISLIKLPKINGNSDREGNAATYSQTAKSVIGFSYTAKSGINLNLSRKVFLSAELYYTATNKLQFKEVEENVSYRFGGDIFSLDNPPTSINISKQSTHQYTLSSLGISVGAGIHL